MTRILCSDLTELLVEGLARFLSTPARPLVQDVVLVHSNGLGTWIEQQLAHQTGVCAGVEFLQPMELVERLCGGGEAWSRQRLVWDLLALLLHHMPALPEVETWSLADGPAYQSRRLSQLALDLAPRFERYALYRPQEIQAWGPGQGWQQTLWHLFVCRRSGEPDAGARKDGPAPRSVPPASPFGSGDGLALDRRALPGRLAVFCPGILPPAVMELLAAAGGEVPLELFVLRPGALRGHPLHHSLGAQAAAFGRLLDHHFAGAERVELFGPPPAKGVLGAVQRALAAPNQPAQPIVAGSAPTIRVHRCGGEQRQVEALRDVLLEAFEDDGLQPRDVLVMTPDIDRFGPLIRAALRLDRGAASPAIPMRLADASLRVRNTAASALLDAVDLVRGRFEVTRVLDLLGRPEVALQWGVEPDTMTRLRELAGDAAIHWGLDDTHRASLDLPALENFTWQHGLDRMLLGLAVRTDDLVLGLAPVAEPDAESDLVGVLVSFVEGLARARERLSGFHLAAAWQERLLELLAHLCGKGGWTVRAVRQALDEVAGAGTHCTEPLPLDAFVSLVEHRFGLSEPGRNYLAGGVTVCAMVPMRSVPFRVVCLVGMDEDAYPRQGAQPAYDIMASDPRDGDVNVRQDDRALLMETVLSTRDRLEIFTTSRSPRDGQERPPAVPVAELLDVLEEAQPGLAAAVTVDHPLQPYAAGPYLAGRSFDEHHCAAAKAALRGRGAEDPPHTFLETPLDPPDLVELRLHRLISCLKNPIKFFCTRSLRIYLREAEDPLSDTEPLDGESWSGGLGQWKLKTQVTRALLAGADPSELLQARGVVPAGTRGRLLVESVLPVCEGMAGAVLAWPAAAPHRVDLGTNGVRLYGAASLRGGRVCEWTSSSAGRKHKLGAWVQAVALRASGAPVDGVTLLHKGGEWQCELPPQQEARALLAAWMDIVHDARRVPLPFVDRFADARNRDDHEPGPYEAWVFGGQRLDGPIVGVPALPGRAFDDLAAAILGSVP